MKAITYFAGILLLLSSGICLYSCIGPVPVDVVMIDNELFFVLEEEHEISSLRVIIPVDRKKMGTGEHIKPMWSLGHDLTTKVEERKYPRLKQIKYGQKFDEFPMVTGPFELQKNVEYSVGIKMGSKFAEETFMITNDNKAIMPKPRFERQKGRIYSVSVDKDGNKTLILEPVSK
jgi:hypothetical protein